MKDVVISFGSLEDIGNGFKLVVPQTNSSTNPVEQPVLPKPYTGSYIDFKSGTISKVVVGDLVITNPDEIISSLKNHSLVDVYEYVTADGNKYTRITKKADGHVNILLQGDNSVISSDMVLDGSALIQNNQLPSAWIDNRTTLVSFTSVAERPTPSNPPDNIPSNPIGTPDSLPDGISPILPPEEDTRSEYDKQNAVVTLGYIDTVWRDNIVGRLTIGNKEYVDTPIADVVADFNRNKSSEYSHVKLSYYRSNMYMLWADLGNTSVYVLRIHSTATKDTLVPFRTYDADNDPLSRYDMTYYTSDNHKHLNSYHRFGSIKRLGGEPINLRFNKIVGEGSDG